MHTKRRKPVIEGMSLKPETPKPIEKRDAGSVRHSRLRKRIKATFALVLTALVYAIYIHYRSTYLRNAGDWRWFWVGEVFVGVWLIFAVVKVLRS